MRRFFALFTALFFIQTLGATAQSSSDGIRTTIQSQIEAFQADDPETAFTFAAPNIQAIFGTPQRFGMMVQQGYPMVWRPADIRFLELRTIENQQWQKVQIRGKDGVFHVLDYKMINLNGDWRINAVQLLPTAQAGA